MLVYVGQDGDAPSGVTTYGAAVLAHLPESRVLLLNAATPPPVFAGEAAGRVTCVPRSSSHDPVLVAEVLESIAAAADGIVFVVPNTGDTPWAAVVEWLRAMPPARRERVRVLGIVHSDMETQYALALRHQPIARVWIGVSRQCVSTLRERLDGSHAIVHELTYPMDLPAPASRTVRTGGHLTLGYVGRLEEPQKRISRLVEVFAGLVARRIEFSAVVAGDGPARAAFEERIRRPGSGLSQRVALPGVLDRSGVAGLWTSHDICLLTSAYEGTPLALLEAMAAGACPVVMAVESGLPELLTDRLNGRVVPQGDVRAMVAVLTELAGDPEQVQRLGEAARATIAERYASSTHFTRLHAILEQLRRQSPPDPARVAADATAAAVASVVARVGAPAGPVAVFGAGMFGRKVVDACLSTGVGVAALVDSDPARQGWNYRGVRCIDPEDLPAIDPVIVVLGTLQFADEMRARVRAEFVRRGLACPEIVAAGP